MEKHVLKIDAGVCLLALWLAGASPAAAQQLATELWGTRGAVLCSMRVDDRLFIGGNFVQLAPNSGGGLAYSEHGVPDEHWPRVAGFVFAVAADGAGGWYLGGRFTGAGGLARKNLAHVDGSGTVTSWAPDPNGDVWCLRVAGDRLYVGGDFTTIGGARRGRVAAFDTGSGRLKPWRPEFNALVTALLPLGKTVLVAGGFDGVNGLSRRRLAECDAVTGDPTAWDPRPDGTVRSIEHSGNMVLVGGQFFSISGVDRRFLAAYSFPTGELLPWDAGVKRKPDYLFDGGPRVTDMIVQDTLVYVAGAFKEIGGAPRVGLAALSLRSARATSWDPRLRFEEDTRPVAASATKIAMSGGQLFVVGEFDTLAGVPATSCGSVYVGQAQPGSWFPRLPEFPQFLAVAADQGTVWIGGDMTAAVPTTRRIGLAVLDTRTGGLTDWTTDTNGEVRAMGLSRGRLIIGGGFSSVGGVPRSGMAALDPRSGKVLDWDPPGCNGQLWTVAVTDDVIYMGGDFTQVGSVPRRNIAAVDAVTGEVLPWNPGAGDLVMAIHPTADAIYIGGFFAHVAGLVRVGAAALDPLSGAALPWTAHTVGIVESIATSDTCVYLGGGFDSVNGIPRRNLAVVSKRTGMPTAFRADATGVDIRSISIAGGVLYAGGDITSISGQPRFNVGAVDRHTGRVLDWRPELVHGQVWSVSASSEVVDVGGRFVAVGTTPAAGIAAITGATDPEAPSLAGPVRNLAATNPITATLDLGFALDRQTEVQVQLYDVLGRAIPAVSTRERLGPGPHTLQWDTRALKSGVYFCRVTADGVSSVLKLAQIR